MSKCDQAFPGNDPRTSPNYHRGLTKREYAAIQIFAAAVATSEPIIDLPKCIKYCINMADSLFEELEK